MPTIIDRLLGREPAQKAVITGTGGAGPGVLAWHNDTPLMSASRNPRRLMKQAQELYHRDLIVRAAEHRVSAALAGLGWHLVDEDEDEVTDESEPDLIAVRDWLEKPQGALTDRKRMTRRALWQVTSRHAGLCGTSFWYQDQRTLGDNSPLVSLYVNPARMYPAQNAQGILLGWKLDADEEGNGGIPLELDEVLQFDFDPPDWGHYGIGLVESAWATVNVSGSLERHEATLFTAGARLAGLLSPKAGVTISDDQWTQTVRDWRNITSDPESAKRLHILRGAVDYVRTGATMQELAVEHIAKMAREDKLALWGVPLSQLPLPVAAGMNSGETKAFDEAVFYQGAVHDRVLIISEVIQTAVLDRIAEQGGPSLQLVIEEPEFDDTTPLFERAQKAVDQPLMANERRKILGLDPWPDYGADGSPLGTAIYIPSKLTLVGSGPDENGNLIALPEPPPEAPLAPAPSEDIEEPEMVPSKAQLRPIEKLRTKVEGLIPETRGAILRVLQAQARDIAAKVREKGAHLAKRPTDSSVWWNAKREETRLRAAIEPHSTRIARDVTTSVVAALKPGKAEPFTDSVAEYVRERAGLRIVGINETTRDAIADLISEGFKQGLGPSEVADTIQAAASFDEARAETIARTESAYALNEAQVSSYREVGVSMVEVIDGDSDAICSAVHGAEWTLDEASADPLGHPNCVRDFIPIFKAVIPDDPMVLAIKAQTLAIEEQSATFAEYAMRPQPQPIVTVNTPDLVMPDIYVTPAPIHVHQPDITVNVPEPRATRKVIERNDDGSIRAVSEEPA